MLSLRLSSHLQRTLNFRIYKSYLLFFRPLTLSILERQFEYVCFRCKNRIFSLSSISLKLVGFTGLVKAGGAGIYNKWYEVNWQNAIRLIDLRSFVRSRHWRWLCPFPSFFRLRHWHCHRYLYMLSIIRCRPKNSQTRYSHYSIHLSRHSHGRPCYGFLFDLFDIICAQSLWSKPTKIPLSRLTLQVESS